jgi:hypothetical protein
MPTSKEEGVCEAPVGQNYFIKYNHRVSKEHPKYDAQGWGKILKSLDESHFKFKSKNVCI